VEELFKNLRALYHAHQRACPLSLKPAYRSKRCLSDYLITTGPWI